MPENATFDRRLCVGVDVQSYGSNDDQAQSDIQHGLVRLLETAAVAAGLDRTTWITQGKGDEELALVPLGPVEPRVVDDFVRQLDAGLVRVNRRRSTDGRLRLRVAMHQGVAYPADNGFAGQAVVTVSRLLNSALLRRALAGAPEANLAVILSDQVYGEVVAQGHTTLRADEFRQVTIKEKEYGGLAWIRVPGTDVHRLPLDQPSTAQSAEASGNSSVNQAGRDINIGVPAPQGRTPAPGAARTVTNVFNKDVDARYATFGFSGGGDD